MCLNAAKKVKLGSIVCSCKRICVDRYNLKGAFSLPSRAVHFSKCTVRSTHCCSSTYISWGEQICLFMLLLCVQPLNKRSPFPPRGFYFGVASHGKETRRQQTNTLKYLGTYCYLNDALLHFYCDSGTYAYHDLLPLCASL